MPIATASLILLCFFRIRGLVATPNGNKSTLLRLFAVANLFGFRFVFTQFVATKRSRRELIYMETLADADERTMISKLQFYHTLASD
jgi:hypothetical protein